ncbi:serologically defined colon cancer antigen 1 [Capsaspora owczarzaki ATCC 30864]|uniref:Serologically defined colon cancer antigen 1 n=1 Tax=Capsaspora owczarzaki (strain ATCC 30864) TaxID=595528 RepID=A0A0D2WQL0_CAPO3|nr:serologically defined colon cancer antigen 1 [Capsaspora owczarzaki ATCC 30864]KJE93248.1 serologically defined colon cancer antigen 1 [Capsaspora owczarzaki ATCC 30864]|eukprot:XP_004347887.2 serologically defined colon cancer antigen 1 [Capsaspora owczarzaki ATCC 30864]
MKQRFSSLDIIASIALLRSRLIGLRVTNVYDINFKTYLFKLAKPGFKAILLVESGIRFHTTEFDWPKNNSPSNFAMKLRKHLRTRRLNSIRQVGADRVIDLEFGSGVAAYHVIVELYDRGNIILTDFEYNILSLLRVRTVEGDEDVRFAVGEKFPEAAVREDVIPSKATLLAALLACSPADQLKKFLNSQLAFGPAVVEHCILKAGLKPDGSVSSQLPCTAEHSEPIDKLYAEILNTQQLLIDVGASSEVPGYIIQRKESRATAANKNKGVGDEQAAVAAALASASGDASDIFVFDEYHPFLFEQHKARPVVHFPTFDRAVDEFYSRIEGQRLDMKHIGDERNVLKKLEKFKLEQERKLVGLRTTQEEEALRGQLILDNQTKVEQALLVIRSALAHAVDWSEISDMVEAAKEQKDPVASIIHKLKLDSNIITLMLTSPDAVEEEEDDNSEDEGADQAVSSKGKGSAKGGKKGHHQQTRMKVDIDITASVHANAESYFSRKKQAAAKEQRTIDASSKALKSAERQTKQQLKQVAVKATVNKVRKVLWFEKFLWFITSENYLVIGGRDMQQNELLVKRHLRNGDAYVHADLHGASSVIVKNPTPDQPVPIRSLCEAGTFAVCYSSAWDAKVITSAWWVAANQVSKTAPTGEYLTTGSFMIRGRKNFLPPSPLILGFGFLYRLDESCIAKHLQERKVVSEGEASASAPSLQSAEEAANEPELDMDVSDHDDEGDEDEDPAASDQKNATSTATLTTSSDGADEENEDDDDGEDDQAANDVEFPDTQIDVKIGTPSIPSTPSSILLESTGPRFGPGPVMVGNKDVSKYLLSRPGDFDENDADVGSTSGGGISGPSADDRPVQKRHYLTAKQRRDMKKTGGKPISASESASQAAAEAAAAAAPEVQAASKAESRPTEKPATAATTSTAAAAKPLPRGKKAKLKKIKDKYGEQDEEERQLRMEILGSAGRAETQDSKSKADAGKKASSSHSSPSTAGSAKKPAARQATAKPESAAPAVETSTASAGAEDATAAAEEMDETERQEIRQLLAEENVTLLDEDAKDNLTLLDSLTGRPYPDDVILFAIPVVAPFSALTTYRHKLKLTPGGSARKGKAVRAALEAFFRLPDCTSREKDLLRACKDTELMQNLPKSAKFGAAILKK